MKIFISLLIVILFASHASAAEVALLNTSILGKTLNDKINILEPHATSAFEPAGVSLHTSDEKIYLVSLTFGDEPYLSDVRKKLINYYGDPKQEIQNGVTIETWSGPDKQFKVALGQQKEVIAVVYFRAL